MSASLYCDVGSNITHRRRRLLAVLSCIGECVLACMCEAAPTPACSVLSMGGPVHGLWCWLVVCFFSSYWKRFPVLESVYSHVFASPCPNALMLCTECGWTCSWSIGFLGLEIVPREPNRELRCNFSLLLLTCILNPESPLGH